MISGEYQPIRQQLARRIATTLLDSLPPGDIDGIVWALPTDREVLTEIVVMLAAVVRANAKEAAK